MSDQERKKVKGKREDAFIKKGLAFLLPFTFFLLTCATRAQALSITLPVPGLSNFSIPSETLNTALSPSGTTVQFTLDSIADVEIDIYKVQSNADPLTSANQVASLIETQLPSGPNLVFWNGLWPINAMYFSETGRHDGSYEFVIKASTGITVATPVIIPTLLQITSVDIHGLFVFSTADANGHPTFPYVVSYGLAKNADVTVTVKTLTGVPVRTLLNKRPQQSEFFSTSTINWDGLSDAGKPVPLGSYAVTVTALDETNGDNAILRTRNVTEASLEGVGSSPQQLFQDNNYIYPNPVRNGSATFQYMAVRDNALIFLKIYTIAGDEVLDQTFNNLTTGNTQTYAWNALNQSGKKLGRGLYYCVIREVDPQGTLQTVKKVAIIQ